MLSYCLYTYLQYICACMMLAIFSHLKLAKIKASNAVRVRSFLNALTWPARK